MAWRPACLASPLIHLQVSRPQLKAKACAAQVAAQVVAELAQHRRDLLLLLLLLVQQLLAHGEERG
jgi:hypothetical protein